MVGRDASKQYQPAPHDIGETVLEVQNLSLPRARKGFVLENVSFELHAGEILGLYGLMGAGRTELFECLMGLHSNASGNIILDGKTLTKMNVRGRIEQGFMLVPEDRQREGLVPNNVCA